MHVSCLPQLLATLLATSQLACIRPTPHPQPCLQQAHHSAMRLLPFPPLTCMAISTPDFNCGAFHCLFAGMKHALAHPQPFACSKQPNTFPASKPQCACRHARCPYPTTTISCCKPPKSGRQTKWLGANLGTITLRCGCLGTCFYYLLTRPQS